VPKARLYSSPGWSDGSASEVAQPWVTGRIRIRNPNGGGPIDGGERQILTDSMITLINPAALRETLANARERLLAMRGDHGHWEGELSTSAPSTATAVCALDAYHRAIRDGETPHNPGLLAALVENGRMWLAAHQNADGGWGDTTVSFSNISTTALCWAALGRAGCAGPTIAAERWLIRAAGGLDAPTLAEAIRRRYGKDHTFSVPILTTLALTGRLGPPREAWRHVPQLPFEFAACPHRWFAILRLPVVSYALPALIAIGQVRHRHRPTRNPLARAVRSAARKRTLRVLRSIQPTSGGFLEATPLTSFVVLSLVGAGEVTSPVVKSGIDFLVQSVREDGSWPIDTNLATWVTSLSIHALSRAAVQAAPAKETNRQPGGACPISEAAGTAALLQWLLGQQYKVEHPYTHAAPGGWAWTDLSGGVPDADDTPGALLALKAIDDGNRDVRTAAAAGIRWLLDLQNADGGMPTFCRGWGTLPFDRSSPDLTAHAVRAWLAWRSQMPNDLRDEVHQSLRRAFDYIGRTQRPDGAWAPLWFGNQHASDELNLTYGTSRVLLALAAVNQDDERSAPPSPRLVRAVDWLVGKQNQDGGWGGAADTPPSIEETALAVESLCAILETGDPDPPRLPRGAARKISESIRRGVSWLIENSDRGRQFPPAPIGFYFAKLWYFERLYPLIFTVAALGRASAVESLLLPPAGVAAEADR
jgi:squalene-hopene/tetraprenyl-beta-curcumene cyclase